MNILLTDQDYHRNGIAGAPFHVVLFDDRDQGKMLGIVFEAKHHVAVLQLQKLTEHNITFGSNSWRGDRYEPHLREAIAERNRQAATPADVTSLTPFRDYEISGVREYGYGADRFCERVPDDEAVFWSLFGHIPGEGADCIGDFSTRALAEECYFRITSRPYGTQRTKDGEIQ